MLNLSLFFIKMFFCHVLKESHWLNYSVSKGESSAVSMWRFLGYYHHCEKDFCLGFCSWSNQYFRKDFLSIFQVLQTLYRISLHFIDSLSIYIICTYQTVLIFLLQPIHPITDVIKDLTSSNLQIFICVSCIFSSFWSPGMSL